MINDTIDIVIQRGLGYIRNHRAFECRWLIMSVDGDHVFSPTKFYANADPLNVARFISARAIGPVNVIVNL